MCWVISVAGPGGRGWGNDYLHGAERMIHCTGMPPNRRHTETAAESLTNFAIAIHLRIPRRSAGCAGCVKCSSLVSKAMCNERRRRRRRRSSSSRNPHRPSHRVMRTRYSASGALFWGRQRPPTATMAATTIAIIITSTSTTTTTTTTTNCGDGGDDERPIMLACNRLQFGL